MRRQLSDIEINSFVRKVFVRHWIDLGRLSMRTAKSRVRIHGVLQRLPQAQGRLTAKLVEAIFREIRNIPSIQRVTANLENWEEVGGYWKLTPAGEQLEKQSQIDTADERPISHTHVDLDQWVKRTGESLADGA